MFAPKKILVPTDFSEFSDNALAQAVDIAGQHKSTIYLVHVLDVVKECAADYCLPADILAAMREEGIKSAREMIRQQIEKLGKTDGIEVISDVREGAPIYEEILAEQKARGIDLIVIASHGRTGLLHHLMGSVADKVTRGATCPVYLVRGPK
jgi:nucleotide-binding universal stress UspA family protein